MSARDVIAAGLMGGMRVQGNGREEVTAAILSALTTAGYRLIGPEDLDRETIERCAQVAESYNHWDAEWDDLTPDDAVSRNVTAKSVAAALRSLQGGEDA